MGTPGRRPGPTRTKVDILDSARALFAEQGYRATTVRAVAKAAGVHAAMINHHFGTKQQLYDAAFGAPVDHYDTLTRRFDQIPRTRAAEALVRHFVTTWRDPIDGPALRSTARGWFGDPAATNLLRHHVETVVIPGLATALDVDEIRIAAAYAHLLGLVLTDTFMGVKQLHAASEEEIVATVAPVIDGYLRRHPRTRRRS
jgi:AcrR family transcriptional regulator